MSAARGTEVHLRPSMRTPSQQTIEHAGSTTTLTAVTREISASGAGAPMPDTAAAASDARMGGETTASAMWTWLAALVWPMASDTGAKAEGSMQMRRREVGSASLTAEKIHAVEEQHVHVHMKSEQKKTDTHKRHNGNSRERTLRCAGRRRPTSAAARPRTRLNRRDCGCASGRGGGDEAAEARAVLVAAVAVLVAVVVAAVCFRFFNSHSDRNNGSWHCRWYKPKVRRRGR